MLLKDIQTSHAWKCAVDWQFYREIFQHGSQRIKLFNLKININGDRNY